MKFDQIYTALCQSNEEDRVISTYFCTQCNTFYGPSLVIFSYPGLFCDLNLVGLESLIWDLIELINVKV